MRGVEHIPWLYDGLMSLADGLGFVRWRQALVWTARGRTLEVGCGTGRNLPLYPSRVSVIGLDPDPQSLARAQRRAPHIPLVAAQVEALPFRAGTFDTVVSSLVFCSVEDPAQGLREIRRVLRAEGRLLMLEHVRSSRPFWAKLQDRIQPLWTYVSGGCRPNRETETAVAAAGFRIDPSDREATDVLRRFGAHPISSEGTPRNEFGASVLQRP
jgi:ubiquinone/menaquinone biosynthesis C-methylase UbiE